MRENNGEKSSLSSFICYSDSNESMQDNKKNNLDKKKYKFKFGAKTGYYRDIVG